MYDHSVRVPLMVVGPEIEKNKQIGAPVYLQDIMPTTLELARVPKPEQVQFKSLLPLLSGKTKENYDAIYGGYKNLQRMITDDQYKLIYYPKINKTLLFNLKNDPQEMKNLADEPKFADKIKELKRKLKQLQTECGDTLVID